MPKNVTNAEPHPISLGLLLTDGFALMSYASIIEPYRAANRLSGSNLYRWTNLSPHGGTVTASAGTEIMTQAIAAVSGPFDIVFVFAAADPSIYRDRTCFAWLRTMARGGAAIAGVSGGPYLLARAGLLQGYRATIHWEHADALREEFPDLGLEAGLYVIDRDRMTCAGGTAGMDLAVELIGRDQRQPLARQVADWFIRTDTRQAGQAQRATIENRYGTTNDKLVRMLSAMEAAIEEPLTREALAREAGISLRQLERLCMRDLGKTIGETYFAVRLDHAGQLLRSAGMSVTDIAIACGFRSQSHFSRAFRKRFGKTPSTFRHVLS